MQTIFLLCHFLEVWHLILSGGCFWEGRARVIRVIAEVSVEEGEEEGVILLECLVLFE